MNRNQAKEFYPFLQAFADGKAIECRTKPSALSKSWQGMNDWTEIKEIGYWDNIEYRIKPEPKYRPFKNAEECWQEMLKHQPFGWVKSTLFKDLALVKRVTTLYVEINRDIIDYKDALEKFTFADDTNFGVKMQEQLMFEFYIILTLAFLYIAFMGGVIGYLICKYWKKKLRMTNEEFFNAHMGERVLYKGKDIGAYVAGYVEEKYIILGFDDYTGCIMFFTSKVKNLCDIYHSYRFAKLKYLEVIKHQ